jgi:hypothetical protein
MRIRKHHKVVANLTNTNICSFYVAINHDGYVALMWPLSTPMSILAIGLHSRLFDLSKYYESWRLSFQKLEVICISYKRSKWIHLFFSSDHMGWAPNSINYWTYSGVYVISTLSNLVVGTSLGCLQFRVKEVIGQSEKIALWRWNLAISTKLSVYYHHA